MTNEELVEQIQSGINVQNNMGLLYEQNRNFIYKLALPYSNYVEIDDLMQEAYFGLKRAVEGFDSSNKFKFLTYAEVKIKSAMQRYYYNHGLTKRISVHTLELIHKYHRFRKDFYNKNNAYPSEEQILNELHITAKKLKEMETVIHSEHCQSMNDIIPGTEDITLEESIADEYDLENDVTDRISTEAVNKSIWEAVKELDKRSSEIIIGKYKNGLTLEKISELLNISRTRVQHMEQFAYKTLYDKKTIMEAAEFYGYDSAASYHYGVSRFKNTFTSSTEYVAIKNITLQEKMKKLDNKLKKIMDGRL